MSVKKVSCKITVELHTTIGDVFDKDNLEMYVAYKHGHTIKDFKVEKNILSFLFNGTMEELSSLCSRLQYLGTTTYSKV